MAYPGLVLQTLMRLTTTDAENRGPLMPMRLGITVSKRVGNAVERNRARRRLRAAAEQVLPRDAKDGYDYVVIGRTATLTRPFPALLNDLNRALRRLHVYRGKANPNVNNGDCAISQRDFGG